MHKMKTLMHSENENTNATACVKMKTLMHT